MNGVVDAATPHGGLHDRGKVVVHENNVRSLLSKLSTSNTHGEPDVGGLEGGAVVRNITSDTNNLTDVTEGFNENLLILRRGPGQDLKAGNDINALVVIESSEERAFHDDTSSGVDTALSSD